MCAAPRSLSQLTTSFIASQTLGIHHTPLIALKKLRCVLYAPPHILIHHYYFFVTTYYFQYVKELLSIRNLQYAMCNCAKLMMQVLVDSNHTHSQTSCFELPIKRTKSICNWQYAIRNTDDAGIVDLNHFTPKLRVLSYLVL